jgi:hypothetical protein
MRLRLIAVRRISLGFSHGYKPDELIRIIQQLR